VVTDPGPFLKFWWKAVDIVASVASTTLGALIVWGVATLFIKHKHRMELELDAKKKRQALDIEWEYADRMAKAARQTGVERLRSMGEDLALKAERTPVNAAERVAAIRALLFDVDTFWAQLSADPFRIAERGKFMEKWQSEANGTFLFTADAVRQLAKDVRAIKIPGEEEF
jgi:hypothetical protein